MTDNEIIKALECCSNNVLYEQCVDCPHKEYLEKGHTCIIKATKNALDLINRLQAENEALIAGQETLQKYIAEQKAEIESLAKKYEMANAEREANVKGFTAEIERLEKDRKENFEMWKKLCEQSEEKHEKMFQEAKATIRPKAIKEFAEEVISNLELCRKEYKDVMNDDGACAMIIAEKVVDNLVKEMVGDDDGM